MKSDSEYYNELKQMISNARERVQQAKHVLKIIKEIKKQLKNETGNRS